MPRIARALKNGYIYHILNRGNAKQTVFRHSADYKAFITLMKEGKKRYAVKLLAYCLMPNHFHMVVIPEQSKELSKWMQWIMTSHVRRYHRYYGSSGHIWQGRFKSFLVQNDVHFLTVMRYVERNPVRKGLVESVTSWRWSSYKERSCNESVGLLDKIPLQLPSSWKEYVNNAMTDKELSEIRKSIQRRRPYGEETWQLRICKELGLKSTMRPIGRPGKKSSLSPFSNLL